MPSHVFKPGKQLDPAEAANLVFEDSLVSLMAHTIRGVHNLFKRHYIHLELLIVADAYKQIKLNKFRPSMLQTRHYRSFIGAPDNISATIFIHPDANRNLARFLIAHELFHLLLELQQYITNAKGRWAQMATSKLIEDQCNVFAWRLCYKHDDFNRNDAHRETYIYFPKGMFAEVVNPALNEMDKWPPGFALDPKNRFTDRPDI